MQAIDHVINSAAKTYYMSAGAVCYHYLQIYLYLVLLAIPAFI